MRPPVVKPGSSVTFTNFDALPEMTDNEQAWHTITSCSAPCNLGAGIGYPLARGKIKFDSGQLGYGSFTSYRGDHRLERLHDAAADQAGQDLHVLLPDPPVHARLDPRRRQGPQGGPKHLVKQ